MRKLLLCLLFTICYSAFSQTDYAYFTGKETFCEFENKEDKKRYKQALLLLQSPQHWNTATKVFYDLTKKDSTSCDAYFFVGYTLRLQNKFKEATAYYYVADSLSNNKSLIFKQNLATTATYSGAVSLGREKFNEIVEYFPGSPEGYYGIATSSIFIGDFENGLKNIDRAISIYNRKKISLGSDVYLTKALLLTNLKRFRESLIFFKKTNGKIKRIDDYRLHYAYSLKKVGEMDKDKKLLKKAAKLYAEIEDKAIVKDDVRAFLEKTE